MLAFMDAVILFSLVPYMLLLFFLVSSIFHKKRLLLTTFMWFCNSPFSLNFTLYIIYPKYFSNGAYKRPDI
jgi:hypothetical protein